MNTQVLTIETNAQEPSRVKRKRINRTALVYHVVRKNQGRKGMTAAEIQDHIFCVEGVDITAKEVATILAVLSGNAKQCPDRSELKRRKVKGTYRYRFNPDGVTKVKATEAVLTTRYDRVTDAMFNFNV
jgi:adenine specific DNA methylase Mod